MPYDKPKKDGPQAIVDFAKKSILIVVAIVLAILAGGITLTVFGFKARNRCARTENHKGMATGILVALMIMWMGGLIPVAGPVVAPMGLVATLILVIVAYRICKPAPPPSLSAFDM